MRHDESMEPFDAVVAGDGCGVGGGKKKESMRGQLELTVVDTDTAGRVPKASLAEGTANTVGRAGSAREEVAGCDDGGE